MHLQMKSLASRIDTYAPSPRKLPKKKTADHPALLDPVTLGTLVTVGVEALGFVSKLLSTDHLVSGKEVSADDIGLDLDRCSQARHAQEGRGVGRGRRGSDTAGTADGPRNLDDRAEARVGRRHQGGPKVATLAATVAVLTAEIADDESDKAAYDKQIETLLGHMPTTAAQKRTTRSSTNSRASARNEMR